MKLPRKMPSQRKIKPKKLLTKLVRRKALHLDEQRRNLFEIWQRSRRAEYLAGGIPYKVTADSKVRANIGTFIRGLNKPFILVTTGLNRTERGEAARHELFEWEHSSGSVPANKGHDWQTHLAAIKRQNPRITRSIDMKMSKWTKASAQNAKNKKSNP